MWSTDARTPSGVFYVFATAFSCSTVQLSRATASRRIKGCATIFWKPENRVRPADRCFRNRCMLLTLSVYKSTSCALVPRDGLASNWSRPRSRSSRTKVVYMRTTEGCDSTSTWSTGASTTTFLDPFRAAEQRASVWQGFSSACRRSSVTLADAVGTASPTIRPYIATCRNHKILSAPLCENVRPGAATRPKPTWLMCTTRSKS